MVWIVQPSKASPCHYRGLINEVIRESTTCYTFTPMCGIFYLPSIDTGIRGRQFNVSSKRHPAGILLLKVLGKFWVLRPGFEPGIFSTADKKTLPLDHPTAIEKHDHGKLAIENLANDFRLRRHVSEELQN